VNPQRLVTRLVTITWLSHKDFESRPQVGRLITQEWRTLRHRLATPSVVDAKQHAGAWSPCAIEGGRVKDGSGPMDVMALDVDDCGPTAMDDTARMLEGYEVAIIPTFSATPEKQKHRIVMLLSRPLLPDEFRLAWPRMVAVFARKGITLDKTCKNINRLYFAPASPPGQPWLGSRHLEGKPINVDRLLEVASKAEAYERSLREAKAREQRPPPAHNHSRYIAGACARARANVQNASAGDRHATLLREAFCLQRLGLTAKQLEDELLDAFVAAAGEPRRREGQCAIRDAYRASERKGAAQ
jgi:hypothetical protein